MDERKEIEIIEEETVIGLGEDNKEDGHGNNK
jgi:hypothetical protein